ncbi:carbohydrate ABC transporter permease [Microbacterium lushaniae]|nr:carbohydrate ABC transporter permease [Microbacterium lushaniae]KAA9157394.1 carbohydrate ABC transporter permease [Microbacterium lushaniae]
MRTERIWKRVWLGVAAIGALIIVSVLVYAVLTAFKAPGEPIGAGASWWPREFSWGNIPAVFESAPFATYFANSTIVGISVTVLNVLTCTAAGYSFSKFSYPGRHTAFILVIATLMIPLEVLYVPLYKIVFDLGWTDSFAGLIVPAATSAFGIFLMKQAIDSVPDELLEAAHLDGAGPLRTLVSVIVPSVTGTMSALALFIFMTNWDSHLWPLLVASDDTYRTLPVGLAAMQSNQLGDAGIPIILMAALIAVLPTVVLFLILQKKFVEGISMNAGIK